MATNKFPPKFNKDLLYPAELNLEDLNMPTELDGVSMDWGNAPLGQYFSIYFPPSMNNGVPLLSYGKHYFILSFTPTQPTADLPRLKAGSRIQFEFKDAVDNQGNRRVIFSDLTPYKGLTNYFIGYIWLKQDQKDINGNDIPLEELMDASKWQADHIIEWNEGGKTTVENGQLMSIVDHQHKTALYNRKRLAEKAAARQQALAEVA